MPKPSCPLSTVPCTWNAIVEGLAQNVLKMCMEYDFVLHDKCTAAYFRDKEEAKRKFQAIADRWSSAIEQMASTNQPAIMVK
jgi:serine/threonine-protein phosphatase 2A regulatory subunit B'